MVRNECGTGAKLKSAVAVDLFRRPDPQTSQMLEEKHLSAMSDFFKVLGDETRMKIINALSHGELCVTDLAVALGMTQSAVSHQLKLLRMANQVKSRREGKSIYYSLDDRVKRIRRYLL